MNLTAEDLTMFQGLGIDQALLERAGVARVDDASARRDCKLVGSGDMSGIAFPYFPPGGDRLVMHWCRVRRDNPSTDENGKPVGKYMAPPKSETIQPHPYFGPVAPEVVNDKNVPVVLVEAEKSVLSLLAWAGRTGRKLLPIGLGGAWGWRSQVGTREIATGKKKTVKKLPVRGLHPDLHICKNRVTFILLDSNTGTNPRVLAARRALATELRAIGADVHILDLPGGTGINGPDDFLAAHGDQAFADLFDNQKTSTVLDEVECFLRKYVVMTDSQFVAVTLWAAHTWAAEVGDFTPYLHVSSPEKQSGKTRVFELLQLLVRKPWRTTGASGAALFRYIDHMRPTLLFDELDGIFKGNAEKAEDVRMILNEGFRREGTVARCTGQNFIVKNFRVGGPKALAGIGQLWDTVADRSIPIRLQRKFFSQKLSRFRERAARQEAMLLQDRLATWVERQLPALNTAMDAGPVTPEHLSDRQRDAVEILFAIADAAGGDWPARTRKALLELFRSVDAGDASSRTRMLSDLRTIFNEFPLADAFSTTELLEKLKDIETSPWRDWNRGRGLTAKGLSDLLKPYGIFPGQFREKGDRNRGYRKTDLEEAWSRYLPPPLSPVNNPSTCATNNVYAALKASSDPSQEPQCLGLKRDVSINENAAPAHVLGLNSEVSPPAPETKTIRSATLPEPAPLPAISPEMLAESEATRSYFQAGEAAWRADPQGHRHMPDTSTMSPFLTASQIELTEDRQIFYGEPPDLRPGRGCDVGMADDEDRKRRERFRRRR